MKAETKKYFKIGISVFILFLCIHYWDAFVGIMLAFLAAATPLIIGAVLAYPINIIMSFYERHFFPNSTKKLVLRSRRIICLILAILSMLAIVALVVLLVIPQLWDAVALLLSEVPAYLQKGLDFVKSLNILPKDIFAILDGIDIKQQLTKIISTVTSGVGNVVGVAVNVVSSVFSGVVNAFLSVIFSLYLLISKESIARQAKKVMAHYLKPAINDKVLYVVKVLDGCFHSYIVGQCTEALILGVLCTIGMLIFGFPYATMVGALVAFTALIPIAGAYIGAGVGAFMIMTESSLQAVLFLVYIIVLQQIEGNIIYPRVVGSSIGLPGIWVLAAVTIGGGVMGIPGMILGVPLAAAAYKLLRENVNKKQI